MSDQRVSNPLPHPGQPPPEQPDGARRRALGVKPDARLAQAFLTQSFLWMFVGLIVTAGVAFFVQRNARCSSSPPTTSSSSSSPRSASCWPSAAASTGSARPPRSACSSSTRRLGLTIGLIVAYTGESVVTAFLSASAMFGAAAVYGARRSARWPASAASCSWASSASSSRAS